MMLLSNSSLHTVTRCTCRYHSYGILFKMLQTLLDPLVCPVVVSSPDDEEGAAVGHGTVAGDVLSRPAERRSSWRTAV